MANPARFIRERVRGKPGWGGAPVIERFRNQITLQHPTIPLKRMAVCDIGSLHIEGTETEIDTEWQDADPILDAPWIKKMILNDYHAYFGPGGQEFNAGQIIRYVHPASGEDITFQAQQLQWTNELDQIEAIADPQPAIPSSIIDHTIRWDGAFGSGLDFRWITGVGALSKFLHINNLSAIGNPPGFIINGGNPVLRLQFVFQKSSGVDIYVNGELWNENPQNRVSSTDHVEFKLSSTGESLWWFQALKAWDSTIEPNQVEIIQRFRKTGPNLFVEILVPWEWLESAVYPVVVDASVNPQVAASLDDANEDILGNVGVTNTALITDDADEWAGLRWSSVTLPASVSSWDDCYMEVAAYHSGRDEPYHTIAFEDGSSPAQFTDASNPNFNISGRTPTTATYTWGDGSDQGWTADQFYSTGTDTLNSIISELHTSYDYSGGAPMVALINSASDNPAHDLYFQAWDYSDNSYGAKLYIEYTAGNGRTTKNTDPQGLGIASGVSRTIKTGGL